MERWLRSSPPGCRCFKCPAHRFTPMDVLTALPVIAYTYTLCTLHHLVNSIRSYCRRIWKIVILRSKFQRRHRHSPQHINRRKQRLFFGVLITLGIYLWLAIGEMGPSSQNLSTLYLTFSSDINRHLHKRYLQENSQRYVNDNSNFNRNFNLSDVIRLRHGEQRRRHPIDCPALFRGDEREQRRAKEYASMNQPVIPTSDYYVNLTSDCEHFRTSRGYITKPLSKEEEEFPIAYSILLYKDVAQVERLLRSIYMPQNFYCLHVDAKADADVQEAIRALVSCFPNLVVAARSVTVTWGHISVIYAELNCIIELLKYQWKYYINLTGQMMPLHSNLELVKILKLYDGANDVEGTVIRGQVFWMSVRQTFRWRLLESIGHMIMTVNLKDPPPKNATIYKGSAQGALSRAFMEFLFYSEDARDLLVWFEDTYIPDEYFWPTLNHNPQFKAPGGYIGDPETKAFTARASIWRPLANQINWSWGDWVCQGKWVREICVYGIGDLPWLAERPELFANKFFLDFEFVTYDCLDELIFNRTVYPETQKLDLNYYKALDIVRHKDLIISPPERSRS